MSVYISEFNVFGASGGDYVEVVAPAGTDLSGYSIYAYNTDGTIKAGPFSLGSPVSNAQGLDVYIVDDVGSGLSLSVPDGLALVDDTGGLVQFLADQDYTIVGTEGPAAGQTATSGGDYYSTGSQQTTDGGATYSTNSARSKGTVACFAEGTRIASPNGPRRVERLRVGDRVDTLDHGPQPIVWVYRASVPIEEEGQAPVLIGEGALGEGRPIRDLVVSSQHRVLVGEAAQLMGAVPKGVFVPAKALVGLPGVRRMNGKKRVTWHHFALACHEIVMADGCATESLSLGPMVLDALPVSTRADIAVTFQGLLAEGPINGPLCRLSVGLRRAELIVAQSLRGKQDGNARRLSPV